jgi:hypothetical protein
MKGDHTHAKIKYAAFQESLIWEFGYLDASLCTVNDTVVVCHVLRAKVGGLQEEGRLPREIKDARTMKINLEPTS